MKWSRTNVLTRAVSRLWLRIVGLLALLGASVAALFPRPALAGCGALDLGACVDAAEYSFYYGLAGIGWAIDRTLLQLAYQLDQFRWYLVETAFTAAYQIITNFVSPVYIPIATVALILACLLFMLIPITGNVGVVRIRHVILWVVLTPVLITAGGQLVSQAEQIRSQVGSSLFAQAAAGAPGAILGRPPAICRVPRRCIPRTPVARARLSGATARQCTWMTWRPRCCMRPRRTSTARTWAGRARISRMRSMPARRPTPTTATSATSTAKSNGARPSRACSAG